MRQVEVLGIPITDYTAKEAVRRSTDFMANSALEIVYLLSMRSFMEAEDNPEYKDYLASIDLLVCDDVELLPYLCADTKERREEIESSVFAREFIKRLVRSNKKILIVSEAKNIEQTKERLLSVNERANIIGVIEYSEETPLEELINDINVCEPDVVISKLKPREVYKLACANRASINAQVWFSLNYDKTTRPKKTGKLIAWIEKHISKKAFDEKVVEYQSNESEEEIKEADTIEDTNEQ